MWRLFFLGVLGLAIGCRSESAFQCQSNEQCGVGGLCEDNGYCTFEDPECPSGRRYGSLAGDGLAGTCVGIEGDGTSAGTTASATDGSGSQSGMPADDGSDESGEAADCGAGPGSLCQPAPPEGWSGPVLAVTGPGSAGAPACPGTTSQVLSAYADLSADPASCNCACETTSDGCGTVDIVLDLDAAGTGCNQSGNGQGFQVTSGTCEAPPFAIDSTVPIPMYAALLGVGETPGCQPQESFALPEPIWNTALAGCEPDAPAGDCDDEATCLPAPDPGQSIAACIHRDGDMTCPLVGYTERFTFFRSINDARACDRCSCAGGIGLRVQCELRMYADPMCAGDIALGIFLSPDNTFCDLVDPSSLGALELVASDAMQCESSGGAPIGEATPSEPVTLCCAS